ncbi:GGDEF domain-containing protein [Noviherbaspirillum galbum]|uniref:diguanylate cyclase n=1 Tax=Noviherbaspirillum galbum TaxID=2709383 RepID=A0A6B3SK55_9BURK|nr:sensor domain-containing diguanylate cyclase [Noviherbaspirillum galbum]NEX59745.1 sensor domain-containing diguanylate cyclase [Noviherbaspirillum galbum]
MSQPDSPRPGAAPALSTDAADGTHTRADSQLLRIRRVGRRLFGVANCVITFEALRAKAGQRTTGSAESRFCYELPPSAEPVVALDARAHPLLGEHPGVTGAPQVRFYASHPIFNHARELLGSVHLVDYAARSGFSESDRCLLSDIAALVERELQLRAVNAYQSDLEKKNKSLRRKSLVDPLLGTWNRGAIMRILNIEAVRCDKASLPLSLIVVDLDHFKKINDTYGHPAGDQVLVRIASRLRACIRPQEALGRYGGEEFLIVLPGSSSQTAAAVADRMRATIAAQPELINDATLNLSISAGVASTDLFTTATTEELISRADIALYAAKDGGRNRVVLATPEST